MEKTDIFANMPFCRSLASILAPIWLKTTAYQTLNSK